MSTQVYFLRRSPSNKFSSVFDSNLEFLRDPTTEPGLHYLKKSYNKMEIEIDSQNQSQLNRIRKSPFLLIQEDSLAKNFKKYPCLFYKSQKNIPRKRHFSKTFLIQDLCSFYTFWLLFSSFKNKNNIISNSLVSILISAKQILYNYDCDDYVVWTSVDEM